MTEADRYVDQIVREFCNLPGTSGRLGPADRRFARSLHDHRVPLDVVRAALLLATARRLLRDLSDAEPLPVVRSLAYFRHTIDELLASPPDPAYLAYVRRKLDQAKNAAPPKPSGA